MKTLKYIFISALFLQLLAVVSFAQSGERSVSVSVSGIGSNERFVFSDHNSREVSFESNKTINWGRFPVGSSYSVTQLEGPRQCRASNSQGTIPNTDLTVSFDCTPRVWVKFQVSGIQSGERFSFGQTGNSATPSGDGTFNWSNRPVGSPLNFAQVSGPRQCTLSNNPTTVPNTDLTVNINCTAPNSFIRFSIFGIETGERFEFIDHYSNYRTYSRNETISWQILPQGSNYKLEQTNGPRNCRMTDNIGTVPAVAEFTIKADCARQAPTPTPTPTTSQTPTTLARIDLKLQINGIEAGEIFNFKTHQITNGADFTQSGTVKLGSYTPGSNYSVLQNGGPRQCRLSNNQGTMQIPEVLVVADCTKPLPKTLLKITVSGIESGENFRFRGFNGAWTEGFYSSQTTNIGTYAVGTNYSIEQIAGPRQCTLTNNYGVVPTTEVIITANCTKPPPTPKTLIKIRISGIESGEHFRFNGFNGLWTEGFYNSQTTNIGTYSVGTNYSIQQIDGPRQCVMTNNSGVVPATEVIVIADCAKPTATPKTLIKITVSGIESGEHFRFNAFNGLWTQGFYNSQTTNIGSYAVGINYSVEQIGGPRQCTLTNNSGVVPTSEVTVIADCRKAPTNIPMPTGTFGDFDLISRSSDQKSFAAFGGTITPAIGGINETGVTEGQFVAYMTSWNVDPEHGGKYRQIMWFNRGNGKTAVVSRALNGTGGDKDSANPTISNNGYAVVFESAATNLVEGDTNKTSDVFVWTLMDDTVRCLTCRGNAASMEASISGDGNYVAFTSNAGNLTAGVDGTSTPNAYVANLRTGEITLISKDPKTGKGIGGRNPSISEDGSRVAFYSYSDKLVDNDTNKLWDIFVWTRGNPKLKRVSLTTNGQERNQGNESASRVVKPTISGSGKYVAYSTSATNMGGAANGTAQQVYVVEVDSGKVLRSSENKDKINGDGDSPIEQGEKITISYDGKWVAFTTKSTNLGGKIIVKNVGTGETISLITEGSGGVGTPTLSRSGKCIAFAANEELDKRFKSTGIFAACR